MSNQAASEKKWADMTKEERDAATRAKRLKAAQAVKEGAASAVTVRIGKGDTPLTLVAVPTGVSEMGSVSYSVTPGIHLLGSKRIRINRLNLSVLAEGDASEAPINLESSL